MPLRLKHRAAIVLACCAPFFAWPAQAAAVGELVIGTLRMDWPSGYSSERSGEQLLLRGPNDERVIVAYSRGTNHFGVEQRERFARMHRSYALRMLPAMAMQRGKVVQSVHVERLTRDTVVYSTASRVRHASADSYYLQYFVTGPFSVALFKIQGDGDALQAKVRFDALFASAHWNEALVTARIK